jgi:hypothetical protein
VIGKMESKMVKEYISIVKASRKKVFGQTVKKSDGLIDNLYIIYLDASYSIIL